MGPVHRVSIPPSDHLEHCPDRASSLGLAAYIYSLDGQTTYTYLAYATSSLGDHGLLATVQTAQAIISMLRQPTHTHLILTLLQSPAVSPLWLSSRTSRHEALLISSFVSTQRNQHTRTPY